MKKYYVLPILLALAPTLSACQDTAHSIVAINNIGTSGLIEISKGALLKMLENKQQFVFEQYSPTCGHCDDLKPLLQKYTKNNKKCIYTCNMYGLTDEEFNEYFKNPYPDIFTDYYVPRIQFIKDGVLTYEVNSAKFSSYTGLKNMLDKHFFSSKITMVESQEDFMSYTQNNKDYVVYMYDQEDDKSLTLAANYLITNEIAKQKKNILLINFINYQGQLDNLYNIFNVDYYAFASLVKNGQIEKTIDWSSDDGTELSKLVSSL